jgi:hypothetical protein
MRSLWRALALAWLGGIGSPALAEDPILIETPVEAARDDTRNGAAPRGGELSEPSIGVATPQVAARDFSPGSSDEDQ